MFYRSTQRSLFSLERGARRQLHLLNRIAVTQNAFAVSQEALGLFERKQSIGRFLSTPTMYGQDEDREPSTFFDFVEIGETDKVQQLLEADPGLAHAKDTCVCMVLCVSSKHNMRCMCMLMHGVRA